MSEELVPMTIGWFDLPFEMRQMVMDEMDTVSKGRLSSCSKDCLEEVRTFKKFIKSISVFYYRNSAKIKVLFVNARSIYLDFGDYFHCILITYTTAGRIRRASQINGEFADVFVEYLQKFVDVAIHLEYFEIRGYRFPFDKMNIQSLRKLRRIIIEDEKEEIGNLFENGFIDPKQFFSINEVHLNGFELEFEHLCNIKSSILTISNAFIPPSDLNLFLRNWENGNISKNLRKMRISMRNCLADSRIRDIILQNVDVIGMHEEYSRIWGKLVNFDEENAEFHIDNYFFFLDFGTSKDTFDYNGFDKEDIFDNYWCVW
ncbi:unnamed protein product [Caenorhabditis angaria]|uniref:Sdz-33 F-box domain-containing protein n=1 Tax=Caenorhabditis angaria TaxID=860376 RepID=A0A9P1MXI3_9PELO|nr:unnamed protein product [Caenorhabditis angaria]